MFSYALSHLIINPCLGLDRHFLPFWKRKLRQEPAQGQCEKGILDPSGSLLALCDSAWVNLSCQYHCWLVCLTSK